ncbi:hypothetical protein [Halorubrum ezzemoulense]|uniref:hypothetical protein n=1 Tax=Halorubrum ezzemoulense TaxID=337243 RepID=UPI002330B92F|nr:hypothetical protein [Halorubrum ezzemoulense]MDB2275439.1 hypothetical protein [Halorubrum ezzemoulense]MDB9253900.1 hypothetical protein [Halorubrum ezzemoulense]MDB9257094.1 hypothetical protein [Halorubrum ezzemoulense]MDB9277904.1 hypothetical protein [Halorubrum ezzemoulense]
MADYQRELETLREIDSNFHRLFEAVNDGDDVVSMPGGDPLATLRRARAQIDAALFAFRRRRDDVTLADDGACLLQWNSPSAPPRRLRFEPDTTGESWTRRELEWTGTGWRSCGSDRVEDVAIRAPAAARYPDPVDPTPLETMVEWIRDSWARPDPPALVFAKTATTKQGVIVSVDGELRYRERDSPQWYPATTDEFFHHLRTHGQPTLLPLSETALTRHDFTPSPLSQ